MDELEKFAQGVNGVWDAITSVFDFLVSVIKFLVSSVWTIFRYLKEIIFDVWSVDLNSYLNYYFNALGDYMWSFYVHIFLILFFIILVYMIFSFIMRTIRGRVNYNVQLKHLEKSKSKK